MPFFLQRVNKENERSLKRGKKSYFQFLDEIAGSGFNRTDFS
jgi:hypothetical protein